MRTRCVSGRTLQPLFWMTSKSYIVSDFEENFHRLTPDAREVIADIGHVKWARSYFPNLHWNVVNIDVPHFFWCYRLTEATRYNIQQTFIERSLMANKKPGAILNYLVTCTRTLFDHIYFSERLTNKSTPYVEMVLHKRIQKYDWWQETKIPLEIPSPLPSEIYQAFDFKNLCY
uniref:Uncharacterized protein n=1 Tax=Lactuca sativa TaxID=4236 RepID=A0A9R1XJQ6_LACSA|nr:hypothetical protein LSAT_V11C300102100 [Lactuca sativa]